MDVKCTLGQHQHRYRQLQTSTLTQSKRCGGDDTPEEILRMTWFFWSATKTPLSTSMAIATGLCSSQEALHRQIYPYRSCWQRAKRRKNTSKKAMYLELGLGRWAILKALHQSTCPCGHLSLFQIHAPNAVIPLIDHQERAIRCDTDIRGTIELCCDQRAILVSFAPSPSQGCSLLPNYGWVPPGRPPPKKKHVTDGKDQ